MFEKLKNNLSYVIKTSFIIFSIFFIIPSIVYLAKNKTAMNFNLYYNFFINENLNKMISTSIYLVIFAGMMILYILLIKRKSMFKSIKTLLIYVAVYSSIFLMMLPWTSSDIFYYMGVGELDSVYNQNPYYKTVKSYYDESNKNIDDEILEQGYNNVWADTTVVYGPTAQLIFSICSKVSIKNIDICLLVFKMVNLIIHILNCYLIYKLSNKKLKFAIIYGLNPFILLEFIGMVHNDIIVVFFILLAEFFLLKKKKLAISIILLSIATGIKYYPILLLPIFILYYFRKEPKIIKRILKSIPYVILFIIALLAQYMIYIQDITIFTAMMTQTQRYSKSIYSAALAINRTLLKQSNILGLARILIIQIFAALYITLCIKLLIGKEIKYNKQMRKYTWIFLLFLLIPTTFQQWYLIGLFAAIPWQKSTTTKYILTLTTTTEITNSIYMFKTESWLYDPYFILGIIGTVLIFRIWKKGQTLKQKYEEYV